TSLGGGSAGGVCVSCKKDGRPRRCRPSEPEIQTLDTADLSRAPTYLRYTADEWAGDEDRMTETKETTAATTPRTDISVKEAWTGPPRMQLFEHAPAPIARLPVRRVLAARVVSCDRGGGRPREELGGARLPGAARTAGARGFDAQPQPRRPDPRPL